jgi:predicted porin
MEIYRMKKSLLAVAALTAFAGAAQAQSSVTVYGILDVGFNGGNQTNNTGSGTTKVTGNQFGESAESTSRLGFKGSEDLGGGKQAIFTAEFTLYPTDPVLSGNTGNGLANRQTFVGLHQNGVGTATIGTQYTGIFDQAAATDPGQLNNMVGDLIYAVGGVAGQQNGQVVNGADGLNGLNVGFTTRTSNTLKLQSDSFSGFRVNGTAMVNNSNATQTSATAGGSTNQNGWGLGADYTWKKLYVTAQYQALKQMTTTATTDGSYGFVNAGMGQPKIAGGAASDTAITVVTNAGNGYNIQDNQGYAAATYDFGILKAYAQYVTRTATDTQNTSLYLKRQAEQIGVRSFVTPTIEAWASAGVGRINAYGAGLPTANFNGWNLGSNYWLSKRTNLYAIYGATVTSNAYNPVSGNTGSQSAQQYAVGIRHTF